MKHNILDKHPVKNSLDTGVALNQVKTVSVSYTSNVATKRNVMSLVANCVLAAQQIKTNR